MLKRLIEYGDKHFDLSAKVGHITDERERPRIPTSDISTSILTMMLSNLGSLNRLGAAASLGSLDAIVDAPSVSTIARSADTMDLEAIRYVLKEIYLAARRKKMIEDFCGKAIGIVDGHEVTSSYIHKCSHCRVRNVSKIEGKVKLQYYHSFVAFVLAGEKFATMLDIEPILPGQGELTSAYLLLSRVCMRYPKAFEAVAGDALYLAGEVYRLLKSHRKYAVSVLKDESRQLYEEALALSDIAEPKIYIDDRTTYRVWKHKIEGLWKSYNKEITVIRSEETKTAKDIEEKTDWMWVTNLPSTGNLRNLVRICHSRWQIENQCFNETVNIWALDHIYRHSENAIAVFIMFLFIAVNIVNIFFNRNIKDKRIKTKVFLLDLVKASLLLNHRSSLPPNPIPT